MRKKDQLQQLEVSKSSIEDLFSDLLNETKGFKYQITLKLIESQYINISNYRSLSGSSYVKLPAELRSSKKGLINIKNNDQKCFLWCHVRHINPVKIHPERITREDKKLANNLNYDGVRFPVREKDFSKIEKKNNICINVFCYENKLIFSIYVSNENLKTRWICSL